MHSDCLAAAAEGTARARLKPHLQEGGDLESAADISVRAVQQADACCSSRPSVQPVHLVLLHLPRHSLLCSHNDALSRLPALKCNAQGGSAHRALTLLDLQAAADASTASSSRATTQIVEHVFETSDGTEADDSLTAEQKLAAKQQEEEAERLKQEAASSDVNETPGEKYHVVCSLGSGIYTQWQSRVVSVAGTSTASRRRRNVGLLVSTA